MRVNEEVRQCVFFLCSPKQLINGIGVSLVGTGFIVSIPLKNKPEKSFLYLVTAKHVAERLAGKPYLIRMNTKKGSYNYISGAGETWFYHPTDDSVDVAVFPYAPSADVYQYKTISIASFLTDEIIEQKNIGIGDEVFITGLFAHACGSQRNQPIIRMGNIAMMPDEPLPTETGNMEAYLIEARSIGGLSGSPAFVYETVPVGLGNFYLLGLMHGHWDIPPGKKNDFHINDEIFGKVNMGIAIVVPAKIILEVINHPKLVELRKAAEEKLAQLK